MKQNSKQMSSMMWNAIEHQHSHAQQLILDMAGAAV
jgi:hypothetical protein